MRTRTLCGAAVFLLACLWSGTVLADSTSITETWKSLLSKADSLDKDKQWDSALAVGWQAIRSADSLYHDLDTNLAVIWHRLGFYHAHRNFDSSEVMNRKALATWEANPNANPRHYARTLNNLGILVQRDGRYSEARTFLSHAMGLKQRYLPPLDEDLARAWLNLSTLYITMGLYAEADRALDEAYRIWQHVSPPPDLGAYYLNRSAADFQQFRFDECIDVGTTMLEQAWKSGRASSIARCVNNLAKAYEAQGDLRSADSLVTRALGFCNSLRAESLDYPDREAIVELRTRSVSIKLALRDIGAAQALIDSVQQEAFRDLPNRHEIHHDILDLQGRLHVQEGDLERGLSNLKAACAFGDSVLGYEHPRVVATYRQLASVEIALGLIDSAQVHALHAVEVAYAGLPSLTATVSEQDALAYAEEAAKSLGTFLTSLRRSPAADTSMLNEAIRLVIRAKCATTDLLIDRRRQFSETSDTTYHRLRQQRRFAAEQLAGTLLHARQEIDSEAYVKRRDSLKLVYQRLSRELTVYGAPGRRYHDAATVTSDNIRANLPEDAVALEYFAFELGDTNFSDYLLITIDRDTTEFVWLNGNGRIDSLVGVYEAHFRRVAAQDFLPTVDDAEEYRRIAREIYEETLAPVSAKLRGKRRVYLSPSGNLNQVSFSGLCDGDGRYLAESFEIQYLDATRELASAMEGPPLGAGFLGLADPDFEGADTPVAAAGVSQTAGISSSSAVMQLRGNCEQYLDSLFNRLPGTMREIDAIRENWKSSSSRFDVLTGPEASESNFKRLAPGREVLHLATHGFSLQNTCGAQVLGPTNARKSRHTTHPLLESGLLLSGARRSVSTPDSVRGEDGVLSALEVAEIDLSGVGLVVLSACATGRGQLSHTEGIFGLRRAFNMAGAGAVLASLWNVPDGPTASLMAELYTYRDLSLSQAVRMAQLNAIKTLRASGLADHPFSWAAFVPYGASTELR